MATHQGSASVSGDATTSGVCRIKARGGGSPSGDSSASSVGRIKARGGAGVSGDATVAAAALLTHGGHASVTGDATVSASSRIKARGGSSITGDATVVGDGSVRHRSRIGVSGDAIVSASGTIRFSASASIYGEALASALGGLSFYTDAADAWVLSSSGTSDIAAPGALPGQSRNFYIGADNLAPLESASCGMTGDPAVSNKLRILGTSSLALVGGYSGLAYVFSGPADATSVPRKLGFKRGDKLKLIGPTGSEPNHGKELTFEDPLTISVMDTLVVPDATQYEFTAFRRNL